jgi:hypothetical protein
VHREILLTAAAAVLLTACILCGIRYSGRTVRPLNEKKALRASELVSDTDAGGSGTAGDTAANPLNAYDVLSVPTQITKIDGTWFIVDCYHDQILYHDNLTDPLDRWSVMTSEIAQGHTVAGDGTVYLADDTDNNRVLVFEKKNGAFVHTQTFSNIGNKPHYIVYDAATDTFYCWSSFSGEMYLFRRRKDDSRVYLMEIRTVEALTHRYVRSFTIEGNRIWFVSGLPVDASAQGKAAVLCCDLSTFRVLKTYPVPDAVAGMAQLLPIDGGYLITVSTDLSGSQDAATILRTDSMKDLQDGNYEKIYDRYFVGGGTPYYLGEIDGTYYLTEHRLTDHAIWSFRTEGGKITDVKTVY